MENWKVENIETGEWYVTVSNKGFQWTRWPPHAAYFSRGDAIKISRWLKSQGFKTKIV